MKLPKEIEELQRLRKVQPSIAMNRKFRAPRYRVAIDERSELIGSICLRGNGDIESLSGRRFSDDVETERHCGAFYNSHYDGLRQS